MPRKSNATKAISGTLRTDRLKGAAAAERMDKTPPAPGYLSARAKEEWARVAPQTVALQTLARSDLRALELLAETLADEATLRETIGREGLTIPTGTGGSKAHPGLRALNDARMRSMQLLNAFGLTPLGRQAIDAAPAPKKENRFAGFAKPTRGNPDLQRQATRRPGNRKTAPTTEG
ncbi:phage terminase small subunit P27 family [Paraburkholderia graminis]|uniref:phage terminase small subunit P27 family n=1 Tax=Paraburkholderia graminis TaxID=60548 RepID=UPI0038BD87D4